MTMCTIVVMQESLTYINKQHKRLNELDVLTPDDKLEFVAIGQKIIEEITRLFAQSPLQDESERLHQNSSNTISKTIRFPPSKKRKLMEIAGSYEDESTEKDADPATLGAENESNDDTKSLIKKDSVRIKQEAFVEIYETNVNESRIYENEDQESSKSENEEVIDNQEESEHFDQSGYEDNDKESGYKCKICKGIYSTKYILQSHVKFVHEKIRPFKCQLCEKKFQSNAKLKRHSGIHFGFQCEKCSSTFRSEVKLKEHTLSEHATIYTCATCQATFVERKNWRKHCYEHGDTPFQCSFCEKWFKSVATLNKHVATHTNNQHVKCEFCNEVFNSDYKFNRHLVEHQAQLIETSTPS